MNFIIFFWVFQRISAGDNDECSDDGLDELVGLLQDNDLEDHCNPFVVSVTTVQQEHIEKFITL